MTEAIPVKQTEVCREIEILGNTVEEISKSILEMRQRLVVVLKETPPSPAMLDKQLSGSSVPLATDIKLLRETLDRCVKDIKDIIRDCEL